MSDPNEELPVAEFFEDKHAIGLIARIDRENGNIKKELVDKVKLTGKPVGNLLKDAIKHDLIEKTIRSGDHGRSNRYQLTERGKAVQSMLRTMGLDETHREYLNSKRELEDAVPDVQTLIKESGLHKKYVQQDFWIRSDFDAKELNAEQLAQEFKQEEQDPVERNRSESRGSGEVTVDILDDNNDGDEDDLNPKERWGEPEEEEDSDD